MYESTSNRPREFIGTPFSLSCLLLRTLLDQGFRYDMLVSLWIAFGLIIIVAVWMQERYLSEKSDRPEM